MKVLGTCWLAALWLLAGPAWAQADEARAKKIVMGVCFLCHGNEGESTSELVPRLAGQHWEYVAKQLENFRSGRRKGTTMGDMTAKLKPDEMAALGRYFEKMPAPPQPPKDSVLAAAGRQIYLSGNASSEVPACVGCHGPDALGTAVLPRLAGQYAPYIETQLKQFGNRERTNDNAVMHAIASRLTPSEMAAVAEFLSGK